MRTTKFEICGVFKLWVAAIGGMHAKKYNDVDAYQLDYSPAYGGWRVERICNDQGGVSDVFSIRLPAREFAAALRMSMRSIEEMRINTRKSQTA